MLHLGPKGFVTSLSQSENNSSNSKEDLTNKRETYLDDLTIQFDRSGEGIDMADSSTRKSNLIKNYKYDMLDHWDFSPSDLRNPMKETDLTGPEYSTQLDTARFISVNSSNVLASNDLLNHKNGTNESISIPYSDCSHSSATDFILPLIYTKLGRFDSEILPSLSLTDTKETLGINQSSVLAWDMNSEKICRPYTSSVKKYNYSSALRRSIFYSPLNGTDVEQSLPPPKDTLFLEGLDLAENKNTSFSFDRALENNNKVINLPSPSEPGKPKLWSCFPAIKTSSSKRSSYKMSLQSPPYVPAAQENLSR